MKERLKNIGIEADTHKRLKMLCVENDWTMTQAVEYLLEKINDGATTDRKATGSSKGKRS